MSSSGDECHGRGILYTSRDVQAAAGIWGVRFGALGLLSGAAIASYGAFHRADYPIATSAAWFIGAIFGVWVGAPLGAIGAVTRVLLRRKTSNEARLMCAIVMTGSGVLLSPLIVEVVRTLAH